MDDQSSAPAIDRSYFQPVDGWEVSVRSDYDKEVTWVTFSRPQEIWSVCIDEDANQLLDNWTRDGRRKWAQVLAVAEYKQLAGTTDILITGEDVFHSI